MIGWAMSLLDVSIVNVAVPELQSELDTDVNSITWVVNAYNLAFASLLIAAGKLADQFGRRRLFIIGMAVFTLGSLLCAISPSADVLIAFRVSRAPAPASSPRSASRSRRRSSRSRSAARRSRRSPSSRSPRAPPARRSAARSSSSAAGSGSSSINLPLGILGIVLARRIWPETYDLDADLRIDYLGMSLLAAAVFCLTFGLVDANHRGWDRRPDPLPAPVVRPAGSRLRALAAPRRGDGHAQPADATGSSSARTSRCSCSPRAGSARCCCCR